MYASLKNKVAIITGASSGIGAGTAALFSKHGANLVLHGRDEKGLDETVKSCEASSKIIKVLGDFKNSEVLKELVDKALENFGKIDILINNAGMGSSDTIETINMDTFDEVIRVNLRSVVELTHLCIPHLIKQKGSVVNVSSVASTRQFPNLLSYSISKSAIDQFTKCASNEVAAKGVRINCVNPGVVPTNIQKRANIVQDYDTYFDKIGKIHPIQRTGTSLEIAKAILFFASDESSFITGDIVHVDGGLNNVSAPI